MKERSVQYRRSMESNYYFTFWCKEQDIEEEKIYKNLDHLWVSSKKGETCILFQSGNNADRLQKEKERLE